MYRPVAPLGERLVARRAPEGRALEDRVLEGRVVKSQREMAEMGTSVRTLSRS